jgi:hypothetical protein
MLINATLFGGQYSLRLAENLLLVVVSSVSPGLGGRVTVMRRNTRYQVHVYLK